MFKRLINVIFLVISFLTFCSFSTFEDPFEALLKKLADFTKKYPQEKVYLHLDKPYYAIGDDIWFAGYISNIYTSEPSSSSSILYVELINERDTLQQRLKLKVKNGIVYGDFKLNDTLAEGNYRIRAYTQLMRNAGPDFFFDRNLRIGNSGNGSVFIATSELPTSNGYNYIITFSDEKGKPYVGKNISYQVLSKEKKTLEGKIKTDLKGSIDIVLPSQQYAKHIIATIDLGNGLKLTKTIPIKTISKEIDVQFFPEGGTLVQGIASRVAVKAIGTNGMGVDANGTIVDQNNNEVVKFHTAHLGMGSFFFNPVAGNTYTAKINRKDGIEKKVALPMHKSSGYVIMVSNTDEKEISIRLTMSPELLGKGEISLLAHKNGAVALNTKIPSDKQVARISIKKDDLPSGIIQLTFFTADGLPIAERLTFVERDGDRISLTTNHLKKEYEKREKVEISLRTEINSDPIVTNLSISVTNADVLKTDTINEGNILTNLLLTSDLRGYIEQPGSYFMGSSQQNAERIDHLLLTQGWRKIDWENLDNSKQKYLAEAGLHISGKVSKHTNSLQKSKVTLISNSGGMKMIETLTDGSGRFSFKDLVFYGQQEFLIQARTDNDKKSVDILIDNVASQHLTPNKNNIETALHINSNMQQYLDQSKIYLEEQAKAGKLSKTIMLKEVEIEADKNPAKFSANLNGPGNADQVIDGEDMINATNVPSYLYGKLFRMTIKKGKPVSLNNDAVKIIVNGNIMPDDYTLYDLKPEDIGSIEVLISPSKTVIYGPRVGPSLLITLHRGSVKWPVLKYAPGQVTYPLAGYHAVREFYSPQYDTIQDSKPDLRTTLFWKPNIITDDNGETKISYFNNDKMGNYRIVIEGMDLFGNLARQVYTYRIK